MSKQKEGRACSGMGQMLRLLGLHFPIKSQGAKAAGSQASVRIAPRFNASKRYPKQSQPWTVFYRLHLLAGMDILALYISQFVFFRAFIF